MFLALSPSLACAIYAVPFAYAFVPSWVAPLAGGIVALCLITASLAMVSRPAIGRRLGVVGVWLATLLAAPALMHSPAWTLLVVLVAMLLTGLTVRSVGPALRPGATERRLWTRTLSLGALVPWSLVEVRGGGRDAVAVAALSLGLALLGLLWWAVKHRAESFRRAALVFVVVAASVVFAGFATNGDDLASGIAAAVLVGGLLVPSSRPRTSESSFIDVLLVRPERMFVATFVTLSASATAVLALPASSATDEGLAVVDAAFTAVSAVCVTGLAVVDTAKDFSWFGQVAILLFIQLGGLGIMTFSTVILGWLGERLSLRYEGAAADLVGTPDRRRVVSAARTVILFTLVTEAVGALALAIAFATQGDSLGTAVWRGVFTSISAFCNAGFALQSDSLVGYQSAPGVLYPTTLLIIAGGLSPVACIAIPRYFMARTRPIAAQLRIIWATNAFLLGFGFLLFFLLEGNASMAGMSTADRIHNAWFQSATLRTAGFNSVDLGLMHPVTMLMTLPLMTIGGSPRGTAGGIKTTTFAVLLLSVVAAFRSHGQMTAFKRRVADVSLRQATVVVTLITVAVVTALSGVLLTQDMPFRVAAFEVVSALGTVGLSIGGTAELDGVGKVIIMVCMFIGRVGTLTMLSFFGQRDVPDTLRWPEEEIEVG